MRRFKAPVGPRGRPTLPSSATRGLARSPWIGSLLVAASMGCANGNLMMVGPDEDGGPDAAIDALDAGSPDVPISDAAVSDAAASDASASDAAAFDAAVSDAAVPDAGPPPPACPRVRVTTAAGLSLNVRPDPNTSRAAVGSLPSGYIADVVGMVRGETIDGVDLWFEIASPLGDGYIFSTYAQCTEDERPADDGSYWLPFACGSSVRVTQGNGGSTSHTGRTAYAFDFGIPLNTPLHAMRAGVVTLLRTSTRPGDPCYDGGGSSCFSAANYIVLQHPDGSTSAYKHINGSSLSVGSSVARGDVIARSGSTGYSTGPHLHLELRGECPSDIVCQTIPLRFADVGVPASRATVTSGNCP